MTWEYKQFLTYRETVAFTVTWEYKQFLTYRETHIYHDLGI